MATFYQREDVDPHVVLGGTDQLPKIWNDFYIVHSNDVAILVQKWSEANDAIDKFCFRVLTTATELKDCGFICAEAIPPGTDKMKYAATIVLLPEHMRRIFADVINHMESATRVCEAHFRMLRQPMTNNDTTLSAMAPSSAEERKYDFNTIANEIHHYINVFSRQIEKVLVMSNQL
jgi:hypothetical protein